MSNNAELVGASGDGEPGSGGIMGASSDRNGNKFEIGDKMGKLPA